MAIQSCFGVAGKSIGFMAIISFIGIFCLVPMRKLFVVKYRLTYPSGTATGTIINGFHTPLGEETAKYASAAGLAYALSPVKAPAIDVTPMT